MERGKIAEIEKETVRLQELILNKKAEMGGVNAAHENNKFTLKQIKVTQNRENKYATQYNEILSQNKEIKQKIDLYRRERVVFDVIYKKLERYY